MGREWCVQVAAPPDPGAEEGEVDDEKDDEPPTHNKITSIIGTEGGPRQSRLVAFFSIVLGSSGAGEKVGELPSTFGSDPPISAD